MGLICLIQRWQGCSEGLRIFIACHISVFICHGLHKRWADAIVLIIGKSKILVSDEFSLGVGHLYHITLIIIFIVIGIVVRIFPLNHVSISIICVLNIIAATISHLIGNPSVCVIYIARCLHYAIYNFCDGRFSEVKVILNMKFSEGRYYFRNRPCGVSYLVVIQFKSIPVLVFNGYYFHQAIILVIYPISHWILHPYHPGI